MKHHTPKTGTLVASGGALTSSYAAQGDVVGSMGRDQLTLLVDYTKGDETSMELEIEFSDTSDFTDAYKQTVVETASGESTVYKRNFKFTATGKYLVPAALYGQYVRVNAKATGGTPTGTVGIKYRMDTVSK